jgi:hypothetical protein
MTKALKMECRYRNLAERRGRAATIRLIEEGKEKNVVRRRRRNAAKKNAERERPGVNVPKNENGRERSPTTTKVRIGEAYTSQRFVFQKPIFFTDADEPSDSDGSKAKQRAKKKKSQKQKKKSKRGRSSSSSSTSASSSSSSSSPTGSSDDSTTEDEKPKDVGGPPAKKLRSEEQRVEKRRGRISPNEHRPTSDGKAPGDGDNGDALANRTHGKPPSGDSAVHGTPADAGANNVTPATGAPQDPSMQPSALPFPTPLVDLVTGLPSASPPRTRPTNLEEVRRVLYDAVTFAYDVRDALASQEYDRFQDLYRNMVAVLPRWMETRDACKYFRRGMPGTYG